MEQWRPVLGYEGLYEVSSMGKVRSVDREVFNKANGTYSTIKGYDRKLDFVGKKYAQIGLNKNSKCKKFLIHRLVAIAFIPNPLGKSEVNHIDHDKHNNCAENLEWVSRSENAGHAKKMGRYSNMPRGESRPNAILTREAVEHIRRKEMRNIEYCNLYGVKPSTITCIQNPKYNRWPE